MDIVDTISLSTLLEIKNAWVSACFGADWLLNWRRIYGVENEVGSVVYDKLSQKSWVQCSHSNWWSATLSLWMQCLLTKWWSDESSSWKRYQLSSSSKG